MLNGSYMYICYVYIIHIYVCIYILYSKFVCYKLSMFNRLPKYIYSQMGKLAKIWEEHIYSINAYLLENPLSEKVQVIQISKIKYSEYKFFE